MLRSTGSIVVLASIAVLLLAQGCQRRVDSATLLAEAQRYRDKGELKSAVIELKNAIQKDPENGKVRAALGEIYVEQGDPVSADKELRRAQSLGVPRKQIVGWLGKELLMQGQFQKLLDELPESDADSIGPVVLVLRANALAALGKSSDARLLLDQALRREADMPEALLTQARLAMVAQRADEALGLVERALTRDRGHVECLRFKGDVLRSQGKTEAALAAYRQIASAHPANGQAHIDIANVLIDAGKTTQARGEVEAARKASPGMLGAFYTSALIDFREGKQQAALEALQLILRAAPDHLPSVLLAGAVQFALHAPQQAEQHLKKFLAAYPQHLYASKLQASIQLQAGNTAAALEMIAPLLRQHGDDVELLTLAGEANLRARQFTRASEYFQKASELRPKASMLHTALALSRLGVGDTARAVSELERANTLDSTSPRTGVLLVMSYLRAGEADKAMATALAMEQQSNNPLVQNLKGGINVMKKNFPAARACFEQALKLDAAYLPALDNLAQLDTIEKHPDHARMRYEAALSRMPKNPALMEAMARLLAGQGKIAEALKWLERANAESQDAVPTALRLADFYLRSGAPEKALLLARKLHAGNPASADALAMLARAQFSNNKPGEALDSYRKLAVLLPDSPMVHTHMAMVQLSMRDEVGALASLRKSLSIAPDLLDAQLTQAKLLIGQKQYAQAHAIAATIRQQRPRASAGDALEADILMAQDKPVPALKLYEHVLTTEGSGAALVKVVTALNACGRTTEAESRLQSWLKEHPADTPTRMFYASSKLAKGELDQAASHFSTVLEREPNNAVALNDLAWIWHQQKDARALATAERAYKLAHGNPAVADTLAWISFERGNAARALPLLRQAAAAAPQAPEIHFHLATVLARTGDKANARKELEQLIDAHKDFPKRKEAVALLATL